MYNNQSFGACAGYGRRFHGHFPGSFARHFHSMPVNIEEEDDRFQILLYAPGLNKEKIKLSAKDDVLTISYKASNQPDEENKKFTRREYHNNDFERSFLLNGKVAVSKISASYAEGILTVILPKDPEKNQPGQEIEVE